MFDNIGEKIKTLAKVLCWVGIGLSVIIGINVLDYSASKGLLIIVIGSLISWVSSFFSYGFGELITKETENAERTRDINSVLMEVREISSKMTSNTQKKNEEASKKEPNKSNEGSVVDLSALIAKNSIEE